MKSPANTKDKSTSWSEWEWKPERGVFISWRLNAAGELEEQPAEPIPPAPLDSNPGDVPQSSAQPALPSTTAPQTESVPPKIPEPVDQVVPKATPPNNHPSGDVHLYMPVVSTILHVSFLYVSNEIKNINFYPNQVNQRPTNPFDPYPHEFGYWRDPWPNYPRFEDYDNPYRGSFGEIPPPERRLPLLHRNHSYASFRTHHIEEIGDYMGPARNRRPLPLPEPDYLEKNFS